MSGIVGGDNLTSTYKNFEEQINGIKQIINSSGLFISHYDMLINQINCLNDMIEQYNDATTPSLKRDLYDDFIEKTDWKKLNERLSKDINNKELTDIEPFQTFKFKYPKLEPISSDTVNNMSMTITDIDFNTQVSKLTQKQKKHINQFNEYRNDFINELNDFTKSIKEYENNAVQARNANETILLNNVEILYNIHLNYAKSLKQGRKLNKEYIYKDDKNNNIIITFDKSQSKFIKSAIKQMLDI